MTGTKPPSAKKQKREITDIKAIPITKDNFQPYGEVITPSETENVSLNLTNGTPRFYLMRLEKRGFDFSEIVRHKKVTQVLGALSKKWYMGVCAPNNDLPDPDLDTLKVFEIGEQTGIKMHEGTWHAGPYFGAHEMTFYNLELMDTNDNDFDKKEIKQFHIVKPSKITNDEMSGE